LKFNQADKSVPIGIVFEGFDLRFYIQFFLQRKNRPVLPFFPTALMTDANLPSFVATGMFFQNLC